MRNTLTLTAGIAAALLAGCAHRGGPISLHAPPPTHAQARAPLRAAVPRVTHLSRLGCVYLRERLGLPALGLPPSPPPGMPDVQPIPKPAPSEARAEAYLASHTNCASR